MSFRRRSKLEAIGRLSRPMLAALLGSTVIVGLSSAPANADNARALIQGSGSSWSANAITQWISDVTPSGLQVVFTSTGSAQGRKDFAYNTTDFAVSDIGYQGGTGSTADTSQGRAYVYLPIVAGGTSFPYQIKKAGVKVRNLRLSGLTLAKIFTNQITNWNDPAVTADNNGSVLPSTPIIPVLHSEGSGSSYQFTNYLAKQYPQIWQAFAGTSQPTEIFPRKGVAIAQNGSDGVMNFVASGAANGAIAYDEFSYPLAKDFPVAKIQNKAGYFTLPTQYNVAVALTKAVIDENPASPTYLLQELSNVFTFQDNRVYPLSSYSYMIIPTAANDSRMTTPKRQTLADYLYFSICQGQAEMGKIGYSPLPINLVQASFNQTAKLKSADPKVDLTQRNVTTCNNPTFVKGNPKRNYLAEVAPQPPACDKGGAGPCKDAGNLGTEPVNNPGNTGGGKNSGGNASGGSGGGNGTPGAGPTTPGGAGAPTSAATAGAKIDPTTGQVVGGATGDTGATDGVVGNPTELAASRTESMTNTLGIIVAIELLLLLVVPPLLARTIIRRRNA